MVSILRNRDKAIIKDIEFIFVMIGSFRAYKFIERLVYIARNREPMRLREDCGVAEQLIAQPFDWIKCQPIWFSLSPKRHWSPDR